MCARPGIQRDEDSPDRPDDPALAAYYSVVHAILMADEQAGLQELHRLLAAGLDAPALGCDSDGYSVLFWAALHGRTSLAAALIKAGATLDAEVTARDVTPGHENTALHAAAQDGHLEMAKLFLSAGGKPLLARFDVVSHTPLHIAALRGDLPMVKLLIAAGADPNACEEARIGYVPLDGAVESGNVEVVRWLLGAGANPLTETWMRMTPLDRAVHGGPKGEPILEEFRKKLNLPEKQWKELTQIRKK